MQRPPLDRPFEAQGITSEICFVCFFVLVFFPQEHVFACLPGVSRESITFVPRDGKEHRNMSKVAHFGGVPLPQTDGTCGRVPERLVSSRGPLSGA